MTAPLPLTVAALCVGQPQPFRRKEPSAIVKTPVVGPVAITCTGLAGDAQANRKYHGGPEMAVHLYPFDHHAYWRERLGTHPFHDMPGAFGENIVVPGIGEEAVHIGERFRLGSAILEISQPRMPCSKIEHRFGRKGMVAGIVATGRCGWYFRVIEEGIAQAGDALEPLPDTPSRWTVRAVFQAVVGSVPADRATLEAMAACPMLSPEWRTRAAKAARYT